MSRENVEIVRRLYAEPKATLAFDYYASDIEWNMTHYSGWTDDPIYLGHEGVRPFMRGWIHSFDQWEPTIERVVDAGDEVVALVNDRAYLKGSSLPITRRFAHRFSFQGGKIVRSVLYSEPAEALEAVGLAE